MIDNTWPNYIWPDGKLKWIEGKDRKWNCEHVSKCDVLIDSIDGMYEWNTDYVEPNPPYRYIFMDELLQFLDIEMRTRPPFEYCNCQPERSKREDSIDGYKIALGDWTNGKKDFPIY